jgi:para-aminobenzoate synthetase/4-amino-4-deoxychorismate lyase
MQGGAEELARFDALGEHGGGRSFRFREPRGVVTAWTVDDVLPALARVEAAVDAGLHAAGFVAYEAAPAFDPALATHPPREGLPLLRFALFARREEVAGEAEAPASPESYTLGEWRPSISNADYMERVERIRSLIAAGDTYQVNLTFRLCAEFDGDDAALYSRLAQAQRSAFCAHLRFGGAAIVSASPELFFRWTGDELELRPMKGTRPRGRWEAEDDALAAELLASPKERAENLMIVDLLRNDAGRISRFGSVTVPRLFEAERYETVHQLTSTIRSRTLPGTRLTDVFRALFPCGSITGAPKVRTSQIIAEMEDGPRGVYTGAIGFVSPGEAVFSVAIRTLVLDRRAGTAELGVGSGITYDSAAGAELRECTDKARFTRRTPNDFRLLETLLHEPGAGFFLLEGHLARIASSARYFGFLLDPDEVRDALSTAVAASANGAMRVRLLVSRDGGVSVDAQPFALDASTVRIAFSAEPVDSADALLYHKTTRRDAYERRAAERPDCGDVLLLNERGEVTESTIANVVVRIGGQMWTPPLECGLLPGVLRAELLRTGDVRERILHPDDLHAADTIYLVNSLRKWRCAELVD